MNTRFTARWLDGSPFTAHDLNTLALWARLRPHVPIRLTTEADDVSGVIEIYLPGGSWPRWCLWLCDQERLQVDDLTGNRFALPYPTLTMALRLIGWTLELQPPT